VSDRVRVVNLAKAGHVRTPDYIVGCTGKIVQFCGMFLNPEDLSVGITQGPVVALYRIKFAMSAVWKEPPRHPDDALCIEIYDHWLIKAEEAQT
jgi:nitrile hydratase